MRTTPVPRAPAEPRDFAHNHVHYAPVENPMSARSSLLVTTGLALVLVSTSGCGFFRRLAGNDTVDLKKAQVESMSVDLRRAQKTICPREAVQMAVFAKV